MVPLCHALRDGFLLQSQPVIQESLLRLNPSPPLGLVGNVGLPSPGAAACCYLWVCPHFALSRAEEVGASLPLLGSLVGAGECFVT